MRTKVSGALVGLGFREREVSAVLLELSRQSSFSGVGAEQLLREALRRIQPARARRQV